MYSVFSGAAAFYLVFPTLLAIYPMCVGQPWIGVGLGLSISFVIVFIWSWLDPTKRSLIVVKLFSLLILMSTKITTLKQGYEELKNMTIFWSVVSGSNLLMVFLSEPLCMMLSQHLSVAVYNSGVILDAALAPLKSHAQSESLPHFEVEHPMPSLALLRGKQLGHNEQIVLLLREQPFEAAFAELEAGFNLKLISAYTNLNDTVTSISSISARGYAYNMHSSHWKKLAPLIDTFSGATRDYLHMVKRSLDAMYSGAERHRIPDFGDLKYTAEEALYAVLDCYTKEIKLEQVNVPGMTSNGSNSMDHWMYLLIQLWRATNTLAEEAETATRATAQFGWLWRSWYHLKAFAYPFFLFLISIIYLFRCMLKILYLPFRAMWSFCCRPRKDKSSNLNGASPSNTTSSSTLPSNPILSGSSNRIRANKGSKLEKGGSTSDTESVLEDEISSNYSNQEENNVPRGKRSKRRDSEVTSSESSSKSHSLPSQGVSPSLKASKSNIGSTTTPPSSSSKPNPLLKSSEGAFGSSISIGAYSAIGGATSSSLANLPSLEWGEDVDMRLRGDEPAPNQIRSLEEIRRSIDAVRMNIEASRAAFRASNKGSNTSIKKSSDESPKDEKSPTKKKRDKQKVFFISPDLNSAQSGSPAPPPKNHNSDIKTVGTHIDATKPNEQRDRANSNSQLEKSSSSSSSSHQTGSASSQNRYNPRGLLDSSTSSSTAGDVSIEMMDQSVLNSVTAAAAPPTPSAALQREKKLNKLWNRSLSETAPPRIYWDEYVREGRWKFPVRFMIVVGPLMVVLMAISLYWKPNLTSILWVISSCIIVMMSTVGATWRRFWNRLAGTVLGALLGQLTVIVCAHTHPYISWGPMILVTFMATYFSLANNSRYSYFWMVALLTYSIVLLDAYPFKAGDVTWSNAALRTLFVAIGSTVGSLASFIFIERTLERYFSVVRALVSAADKVVKHIHESLAAGIPVDKSKLLTFASGMTTLHSTAVALRYDAEAEVFYSSPLVDCVRYLRYKIRDMCYATRLQIFSALYDFGDPLLPYTSVFIQEGELVNQNISYEAEYIDCQLQRTKALRTKLDISTDQLRNDFDDLEKRCERIKKRLPPQEVLQLSSHITLFRLFCVVLHDMARAADHYL